MMYCSQNLYTIIYSSNEMDGIQETLHSFFIVVVDFKKIDVLV